MKPLCIYHGGCDDGVAAALIVKSTFPDNTWEFYPGVYQKPPPAAKGRHVLFVDFSYKRPVLEEMAKEAASIVILDHHFSASEDLADLPKPPEYRLWQRPTRGHIPGRFDPGIKEHSIAALFDMERSGAGLAWDFFLGGQRPAFINYIEDRDLWRKKRPFGDEFTIALRSYPQDFGVWENLMMEGVESLIASGHDIQRYYRRRVEELKASAYPATIHGEACWIANAPYFAASEVAGELCEKPGADFGACYFEAEAGRFQYSLRSRGDYDVTPIARAYGGGGHKSAAGFSAATPVHLPEHGKPFLED
jgi:oligoribonuclease NrnB/cAMP/cGMP phosphodiesterase (DHH superfamily)